MVELRNWAGNLTYSATDVLKPGHLEEVREAVLKHERIRPIGTRHSFNAIADTDGVLLSTERLNRIVEIDRERKRVTVEAGVRFGELGRVLDEHRLAVPNLASLPHISVAGAYATGTHGSGDGNGNLATSAVEMELVSADGEVHQVGSDRMPEFVIHLGALGVVTKLTLQCVDAFDVRQSVFVDLPFEAVETHFDEITGAAYSVSFFTDWTGDMVSQVWVKRRSDGPPVSLAGFGARPASMKLHPIPGTPAEFCTEQLDEPGPSFERLPHFRLEFTPSSGEELQAEYLIPRHHIVPALRAVRSLGELIAPHLHISEVRTIAGDRLWMSPCYRQPCVAIHFTWKQAPEAIAQLLPQVEAALAPFQPRPHWGKLSSIPEESVRRQYPRLGEFRSLVGHLDPNGKFRNAHLQALLGPSQSSP